MNKLIMNDNGLYNYDFIPIKNDKISIEIFDRNSYLIVNSEIDLYLKVSFLIFKALELTDGKRNISQIYNKLNSNRISINHIYQFFNDDLSKYGIIINGESEIINVKSHKYINFKIALISSKLTTKISSLLSPLHRKYIFLPTIFLFFISFLWIIYDFDYYAFSTLKSLAIIKYTFLIIIAEIIITLFHELGHSSALYYYKGKPKEIGFGLYLVFPVFYSNVSDAWRCSIKNRIKINFGGIYFEIILLNIILLLYVIFKHEFFYFYFIFNLVSIAYNLNPLFRTDGYWILSDLTNTPNLTSVSAERMKDFFNSFFSETEFMFVKKDFFLISYAILSQTFIIIIIFSLFVYNKDVIVNFLPKIIAIVKNLTLVDFYSIELKEIAIPIIFYIIITNYIFKKIKSSR